MLLIRDLVQHALITGRLTIAAEEELRQLLCQKYGTEDIRALMKLQEAAMQGHVRQESRELWLQQSCDETVMSPTLDRVNHCLH